MDVNEFTANDESLELSAQGGIPIHRFGLVLVALLGACGVWTSWPDSVSQPAEPHAAVAQAAEPVSFDERFVLPLPDVAPTAALMFSDRFASALVQGVPSSSADTSTTKPAPPAAAVAAPSPGKQLAAAEQPKESTTKQLPRPSVAARTPRKGQAIATATGTWRPEPAKEEPSIFEKLFGNVKPAAMMAYASADPSANIEEAKPLYDRQTAVYDITAKTVYLPNGTRLEAHSGLGEHFDDPKSERLRMRGVTPPHVYDLTLRESMFHGVQAIRLNPVGGEDRIHGRDGLLAHPYMLGGKGESNGCMSVKDYPKFLEAFTSGQIKRLVVVAKLS